MHPAVFVDIVGNDIVRVVMISNNFKTRIVPPHLRGPASYYFHTEPEDSESNGTVKYFLARDRVACSVFCSSGRIGPRW